MQEQKTQEGLLLRIYDGMGIPFPEQVGCFCDQYYVNEIIPSKPLQFLWVPFWPL
jgi:hypothetical protein